MSTGKMYKAFVEENEWEGETWWFFIPTEGNEQALEALENLIEDSDEYELVPEPFTEEEVNAYLRVSNTDYMDEFTKTTGKLKVVDDLDNLYKGGIRKFMVND